MEDAVERDAVLRQRMGVMPPERFEQLVFELAHREDPGVRRLRHPDAGADTLRPATADRRAEVWQAKRYPGNINWKECEKSLDAAIGRWSPSVVTFAFPRDLSQQLEKSFETRLLNRQSAQSAGVEVRLWNASELVRRLDEHPDLKARLLGAEQDDVMLRLDRMARAGGKLEGGRDLVERAKSLGDFAEQWDADFTYSVASSGVRAPRPNWEQLPFMTFEVLGGQTKVRLDAWVRDGAEVELPRIGFGHDEEGQAARREAVERLARGESAVVGAGGQLRLQPPKVLGELMQEAGDMKGTATLHPGEPLKLRLEIEGPGDARVRRDLQIRPVPPAPGPPHDVRRVLGHCSFRAQLRAD